MVSKGVKSFTSILLLGCLVIGAAFVTGCGQQESNETEDNGADSISGTITIAGSTSVQPLSEVLAEKFMEKYPEVQVNVQGGGSSQGVAAAISGAADIGSASRNLKEEEKQENLVETVLAYDGIAIVVHPANKIDGLSKEDIKNIYLGNITNWNEVGGEDALITVVCREAGSGTRGAFEEIVMEKEDISDKVIIQNSNGAVRTTVAGDKNSIGFISLAIVNDEVKAIKIDDVEPSVDNIKNGSYKISRPFLYLTKEEPQGIVKAYIDFTLSEEGQSLIVEEGAISSR